MKMNVCGKTVSYENGVGRMRGHFASCCDTDEVFTISVLFDQLRGERGMLAIRSLKIGTFVLIKVILTYLV